MSRGLGVVQEGILQHCWARAEADPDDPESWWISLDELAGQFSRTRQAARRESCRRAISRLAAAGELERGWRQGVLRDHKWVEDTYLAEDLPEPRSSNRLLCCRIPPALVRATTSANTYEV